MKKTKFLCACLSATLIASCVSGMTSLTDVSVLTSTMLFAKAYDKQELQKQMAEVLYNGDGGQVNCDFDGYVSTQGRHEGIDFFKGAGSNVYSLIDGVVTNVVNTSSSLSTLAIYDPTHDCTVIYLHTANICVSVGENVSQGQRVAIESNRGASAAHTHVEVREGRRTLASKSVNDPTLDNSDPYPYWDEIFSSRPHSPEGWFDAAASGDGVVSVRGWGFDPDTPDTNIEAHVYLIDSAGGNHCIGAVNCNQPRSDVNEAYGISGDHGFEDALPVAGLDEGTYQILVALIDTGGGPATWLDSGFSVDVHYKKNTPPVINIDAVKGDQGTITVAGWAYDPDDPSTSLAIHVYIDDNEWVGGTGCVFEDDDGLKEIIGAASSYTHRFNDSFVTNLRGDHVLKIAALDSDGGQAAWAEVPFTITEPVDFGDEFDAQIIHNASGKYIYSAGTDSNVLLNGADTENAYISKMIWHFVRQDDGSYRIRSYYNDCYIDAFGAEDADGVNIWTYPYDPYSAASKWFIIKNGDGYSLRPSYTAKRVMDVTGNYFEDRTNIQLHESNGTAAQIFTIKKLDGDTEKPVISDVTISDVTLDGYRVTATVSDNVGVKRVQVPTWTESHLQKGEEEQDDLVWHDAVQVDKNTWVCDISLHNDEHGKYISDVYVFDFSENAEVNRQVVEVGMYNLTIDPNGGSVMDTETKKASSKAVVYSPKLIYQWPNWCDIKFAAASRKGYTLTGYYTKKSGGVKVYNADGKCVNEGTYFKDNNYQLAKDLTVYAQWKQIIGDVNGDNTVSVQDVVTFQKWLLAKKGAKLAVPENADMNQDGVVDVYDLALLKRKLLNS